MALFGVNMTGIAPGLILLLFLVTLLQTFKLSQAKYDHDVRPKPECERQGDTIPSKCIYNFTINYRMTGVWYDAERNTGKPVFKQGSTSQYYYGEQYNCSALRMPDQALEDVLIADGSYRRIYTINGQSPGESIVVYNGTQVIISVTNDLQEEGITIHWHGIVQRNTPFMDGVARITQCAINPGETFVYRFIAYPPGTHWYHAHLGTLRADGLFGALIVIDPDQPRKETDVTMMLTDWLTTDSSTMVSSVTWELERFAPFMFSQQRAPLSDSGCYYQTKQHDGTDIGVWPVQSILINGKGTACNATHSSIHSAVSCNHVLEEFVVPRHKKVLFRIINAGAMYAFKVSIDSHSMTVEALDGNVIQDTEVIDYLIIHAGERYDVVINTDQYRESPIQPVNDGYFWMRIESLEEADLTKAIGSPKTGWAVLKYEGSPQRAKPFTTPRPCPASNPCEVLNCPFREFTPVRGNHYICIPISKTRSLRRLLDRYPVPIPPSSDTFQQLFLNFHFSGSKTVRSSINGHRLRFPKQPPQLTTDYEAAMYKCDEPCTGDCYCSYYEKLKLDNVVQVVLMNMGVGRPGTAHPVHIHGHHFHVIKIGYPVYDGDAKFLSDSEDVTCVDSFCSKAQWTNAAWNDFRNWNNSVLLPTGTSNGTGNNNNETDNTTGGRGRSPLIPEVNMVDPPLKDTVVVPVGGYVVVRFKADNPGWWFVHCHIEVHTEEGMAMFFQEGNTSDMPPAPKNIPKCGDFELSDYEFEKALTWKRTAAATDGTGQSTTKGTAAFINDNRTANNLLCVLAVYLCVLIS